MSWRKAFDQAREFASANDEEVRRFVAGTKGIKQMTGLDAVPTTAKRPSPGDAKPGRPADNEDDQDSDKEGGFRQPKKLAKFVEHEQFDVPAAFKAQDKSARAGAKQQKHKKKKQQSQQRQQLEAGASSEKASGAVVDGKEGKKSKKAGKHRPDGNGRREGSDRRDLTGESNGVVGMEV